MDHIIFLDCDGVLNNAQTREIVPETGFIGADENNIIQLVRIIQATNAEIVLSSTWQNDAPMLAYLKEKLAYYNLKIIDTTHEKDIFRGHTILKYVNAHQINHYVILDDYPYEDFYTLHLEAHLVQTDFSVGLSSADVASAIQILEGGLA